MSNEYNHLSQRISSLEAQVNQLASQVAQMSRPPVLSGAFLDNMVPFAENDAAQELLARPGRWVVDYPVNTEEPGKRIPVAFSDPEMQRAYDAGEPFKTPDECRIEELERALAGMLFEFDDGVNGGHRESPDEHVAALDYARTLVKAEEFKA